MSATGPIVAATPGSRLAGKVVLLVDDDQDIRELYTVVLPHVAPGLRIITVCTGREAIQRARELRPDVVLMDLSMPGLDGIATTRYLKADPLTRAIPVIAVTAEPLKAAAARDAGCVGYVQKPSTAADLLQEISRALRISA